MTDLFQFFIYTNMCRVSGFEFLGELHCISLLPPIFIFFFYIKINVNLQIKEINKCLLVFAVLLILRLNTQNVPYFFYIVKCKQKNKNGYVFFIFIYNSISKVLDYNKL